jgi:adenosylcobinamide-GDP ribazoletransferase
VPAARPEGLGATVAGTVHRAVAGLALLLLLGLSALASHWFTPWWTGPVVVSSALLGGAAVVHRTVQRFGGITGDVLGAVIEVSFASALTASALLLAAVR